MKSLDSITTYSSISVACAPAAPTVAAERNAFVEAAEEAWGASLSVVVALGAGLTRVLVYSWWPLPILVIAYLILWRRRSRGDTAPPAPDLPSAPVAPVTTAGG